MPIYEYECVSNGHRFEELQKLSDDPIKLCKVCGSEVKKLVSAAGFQFKGGGWYKDGYASVNKSNTATGGNGSATASGSSGASTPASTTTATATKSEPSPKTTNSKEKHS